MCLPVSLIQFSEAFTWKSDLLKTLARSRSTCFYFRKLMDEKTESVSILDRLLRDGSATASVCDCCISMVPNPSNPALNQSTFDGCIGRSGSVAIMQLSRADWLNAILGTQQHRQTMLSPSINQCARWAQNKGRSERGWGAKQPIFRFSS